MNTNVRIMLVDDSPLTEPDYLEVTPEEAAKWLRTLHIKRLRQMEDAANSGHDVLLVEYDSILMGASAYFTTSRHSVMQSGHYLGCDCEHCTVTAAEYNRRFEERRKEMAVAHE